VRKPSTVNDFHLPGWPHASNMGYNKCMMVSPAKSLRVARSARFLAVLFVLLFILPALAIAQDAYDHPLYDDELPLYPGAKVIRSSGSEVETLKDGLRLRLTTPDPVVKVADFYKAKMSALGWEVPNVAPMGEKLYIGRYKKGMLYYQVTVARASDGSITSIDIVYVDR